MRVTLGELRENQRLRELVGFVLLVVALVSLLALVSFDGGDRTWFSRPPLERPPQNWIGTFGATLAETYLQLFGVATFSLPFVLGWIAVRALLPVRANTGWPRVVAYASLGLALLALLDLLYDPVTFGGLEFHPGGYVGWRLAGVLRAALNPLGAVLLSVSAIVAVLILVSHFSVVRSAELTAGVARRSAHVGTRAFAAGRRRFAAWRAQRRRTAERRPQQPARPPAASPVVPARPLAAAARRESISLEPAAGAVAPPVAPRLPAPTEPPRRARSTAATAAVEQPDLPMERGRRGYSLPPIELLNEAETQSRESEKALLERAQQITEKFREFAIEGAVVAIHPGPVVTTFEFKPDAGVKYSKITSMTDDLSLALKAESVRIDRLPGRSTVGIEVPNRNQETIFPRELMDSERYRESRSKLTLALGKDIHGDVYVAELDRMPHLMIAGATGAGKSVGLNGMIVSMLYKSTPHDLRFVMIDTKMIELGIYSEIPHLLIPVVTEPKQASVALKWAVREMELRYRRLAAVGVRNIAQFNALLEKEPDRTMEDPKGGDPIPLSHLPYIVIVIDEMADLMMVSSADVEESVMRLAQMARAVGIHLILATQRPSVDVITGTIKANFPSRIAFRVSQRVDSRTIIDQQGAEHLLGRGDMLFLPTGSARVVRLHSGFITESEINRITSFLKKMAKPVFDETVLRDAEEFRGAIDGGERDEMFVDAVRTVLNEGKCSITLIQRRLQLGYARAARIVDMMEQEGVVSPGEGSKPREVLVGPEFLETLQAPR